MKKIILGLRYLYHKLFSGFYHLGWKVVFDNNVKILNPGYISIGDNTTLDSESSLAVIGRYLNFIYKQNKPVIQIDECVGIGKGTVIYAINSIRIKKHIMISPYCFITDYDHKYKEVRKFVVHQPLTNIKPVLIEEGAWIGVHVTVCSGVTIGKNAVIGANSVVKTDIPAYSVAVGVPAKVIKKYNHKTQTWERVDI